MASRTERYHDTLHILNRGLEEAEKLWEKKEYFQAIGYLRGTIESAIVALQVWIEAEEHRQ